MNTGTPFDLTANPARSGGRGHYNTVCIEENKGSEGKRHLTNLQWEFGEPAKVDPQFPGLQSSPESSYAQNWKRNGKGNSGYFT